GQERHLAEQVAAAERDAAAWKDNLGGAGSDEIAGVALIALAHDQLAWRDKPGSQQLLHPLELLLGQIGEQVEAPDQFARVESEIETWPRLSLFVLDAALEVLVDLSGDQAFLEQRVVTAHLAPHRRLTQEPGFESRRVLGILPSERVESGCRARKASFQDGVDHLDHPRAE